MIIWKSPTDSNWSQRNPCVILTEISTKIFATNTGFVYDKILSKDKGCYSSVSHPAKKGFKDSALSAVVRFFRATADYRWTLENHRPWPFKKYKVRCWLWFGICSKYIYFQISCKCSYLLVFLFSSSCHLFSFPFSVHLLFPIWALDSHSLSVLLNEENIRESLRATFTYLREPALITAVIYQS